MQFLLAWTFGKYLPARYADTVVGNLIKILEFLLILSITTPICAVLVAIIMITAYVLFSIHDISREHPHHPALLPSPTQDLPLTPTF